MNLLLENNDLFPFLMNSNDFIAIYEMNSDIVYANKAWKDVFEYKISDFGKLTDRIHLSDINNVIETLSRLKKGKKSLEIVNLRILNNQSEYISLETKFLRINIKKTNYILTISKLVSPEFFRENLSNQQSISSLVDSDEDRAEVYKKLLIDSNDGIILFELDNYLPVKLIDASEEIYKILEFTKDELLNIPLNELMNVSEFSEKIIEDHPRSNKINNFQITLMTKTGKKIEVIIKSRNIKINSKIYTISIVNDINLNTNKELIGIKKKYETAINLIEVILITLDRKGNIISLNRKGKEILGYEDIDLRGKNWFTNFIPSESRIKVQKIHESIIERELIQFAENPVITRTGQTKLISWSNIYLKDDKGNVIGTISSGIDITEERNLYKALITSEEKYSKLFNESPFMIFLINRKCKLVDHNLTAERVLGLSSSQLKSKPLISLKLIQEKDLETHQNILKSILEGKVYSKPIEIKLRISKREKIFNVYPSLVEITGIKLLQVLALDITEQKQLETKLRESERKFSSILSNLQGLAYRCKNDVEWTALFLSNGCKNLTGYSKEDLYQNNQIEFIKIIHPEDREYVRREIEKSIEGKSHFSVNYRINTREGKIKWINDVGAGIYSPETGKLIFLEGFMSDISDFIEIENKLKEERNLFREIAETSPTGLIMIDKGGRISYANARSEEILRLDEFSIKDRLYNDPKWNITDYEGRTIPDKDLPFNLNKRTGNAVLNYKYAIQKNKKSTVFLSINSAPLFTSLEKFNGVVAIINDITDQIVLERQYTNLFDTLPIGVFRVSLEGIIHKINPFLRKLLGYSKSSELASVNFFNHFQPEGVQNPFQKVINLGKKSGILEIEISNILGESQSVRLNYNIVDNKKLVPTFIEGIIENITTIKSAEESILKLSTVVEQSPVMIIITNLEGYVEYANKKFFEMTNYDYGEIIGKKPILLQTGDIKTKEEYNTLWDSIRDNKTYSEDYIGNTKSGKVYWESVTVSPIKNVFGDITHFLIFKEDITERKKESIVHQFLIQEEVAEKTKSLREEKEKIEKIVETIPDGVIAIDYYGNVTLINKKFESYKEEFFNEMPRNVRDFPLSKNFFINALVKSFYSAKSEVVTIEPKPGLHLQILSSIPDFRDDSAFKTIMIIRDISLFIEFENMQKEFVSTVSHELRTPISAINQSIDNLQMFKEKLDEEKQNFLLSIISRNTKILAEQIEDLLIISRIEARRLKMKFVEFSLFKLVHKVISLLSLIIDERKTEISIQIPEELKIYGDMDRFEQVIRILVDNGIKYTEFNGKIQIKAISDYKGRYNPEGIDSVLIQIHDNGIGILDKDVSFIFNRFYRASNARSFPGTGLGLSIAKDLIELQCGRIYVDSVAGEETTFSILMPLEHTNQIKNETFDT